MESAGLAVVALVGVLLVAAFIFALLEVLREIRKEQMEFKKRQMFKDPNTDFDHSLNSLEDIADDKEKLKEFEMRRQKPSNLRAIRSTNFYRPQG